MFLRTPKGDFILFLFYLFFYVLLACPLMAVNSDQHQCCCFFFFLRLNNITEQSFVTHVKVFWGYMAWNVMYYKNIQSTSVKLGCRLQSSVLPVTVASYFKINDPWAFPCSSIQMQHICIYECTFIRAKKTTRHKISHSVSLSFGQVQLSRHC